MMPKMGRGMKVLFCSFCLNRSPDRATNDQSFSQGIDVSHLATPHSSYNLSNAAPPKSSSNSVLNNNDQLTTNSNNNSNDNNDTDVETNYSSHHHHYSTPNIPNNCILPPNRCTPDGVESRRDESSPAVLLDRLQHQSDNNLSLPSPHSSSTTRSNIYDQSQEQPHQLSSNNREPQIPHHHQQHQEHQIPQDYNHNHAGQNIDNGDISNRTSAKLSYDIISVREPLAKILAERQMLHQAQQQQRQILGDHEYIEVYGERGSSCFYEEIAGSTTSSATYDQIGNISNHNYQALINAYAVTNRANKDKTSDNRDQMNNTNDQDIVDDPENIYNLAQSNDEQPLKIQDDNSNPKPSTSFQNRIDENISQTNSDNRSGLVSQQSVPVYSVINKASRRSDANVRPTIENFRPPPPPPPPPKNQSKGNAQQTSTSAIPHYQQSSMHMNSQFKSSNSQISGPSTSTSFKNLPIDICMDDNSEHTEESNIYRLPQPPPRHSKLSMLDATKRPLPLPDNYQVLHKSNTNKNSFSVRDEDIESLNNGYELLTNANFNEDVGYEKIRETHQYSGGSISSQLNPLQLLDNEGYESVQPIYSSPSNALVEPNYEAIEPATASELAAAATARLNAAAAVIDYLKQDQP